MEIYADIGGTKSLFHIEIDNQILEKKYYNADFKSFDLMISDLVNIFDLEKHFENAKICLAVAAPIMGEIIKMTNIGWEISKKVINRIIPTEDIYIINDLQAVGYYIAKTKNLKYLPLKKGSFKRPNNTFLAVGIGTGFGMAIGFDKNETSTEYVHMDPTIPIDVSREYSVKASEAGHVKFSPSTSNERNLFADLANFLGEVTIEDVCSGRGIYNIYRAMTDGKDIENKDHYKQIHRYTDYTKEIIKHSKGRTKCEICQFVIKNQVEILAHKLSDLSLELLPYQGIFLFGGIVTNILSFLNADEFSSAFKGRDIKTNSEYNTVDENHINNIKNILNKIPIYILTEDNAVIYGTKLYLNTIN